MAGHTDDAAPTEVMSGGNDDLVTNAATVGIICVGAALFEAALIPGMVIGVAAMLAPRALPRLGTAVEPVFRGVVRGIYKVGQKARHIAAEAEEQVRDVVGGENGVDQGETKSLALVDLGVR